MHSHQFGRLIEVLICTLMVTVMVTVMAIGMAIGMASLMGVQQNRLRLQGNKLR